MGLSIALCASLRHTAFAASPDVAPRGVGVVTYSSTEIIKFFLEVT